MIGLDDVGIVPVVVLDDSSAAVELAAALSAGGICCAEITLRTPVGLDAIQRIAGAHPDFHVGAGTVLSADDVDRVADAGARFVVSPGLDPAIVDRARERGLAAVPGVATATELQHAHRMGLDHVKFFPAASLGGLPAIAALSGPFPAMRFLPSGGVNLSNAADYFAAPSVFAISGSWMVARELLAARAWSDVEQRCAEALRTIGVAR